MTYDLSVKNKRKNLKNIELQELTEQEYANDRFTPSELELTRINQNLETIENYLNSFVNDCMQTQKNINNYIFKRSIKNF